MITITSNGIAAFADQKGFKRGSEVRKVFFRSYLLCCTLHGVGTATLLRMVWEDFSMLGLLSLCTQGEMPIQGKSPARVTYTARIEGHSGWLEKKARSAPAG